MSYKHTQPPHKAPAQAAPPAPATVVPDASTSAYSERIERKPGAAGEELFRMHMQTTHDGKLEERSTDWAPRHMFLMELAVLNRKRTEWIVGDTRGLML